MITNLQFSYQMTKIQQDGRRRNDNKLNNSKYVNFDH